MSETVRVTAEHIARGRPEDPCGCPIALAMKEQLGLERIHVTMGVVAMERAGCDLETRLPREAANFIWRFDHGNGGEPFEFTVTLHDQTAAS